MYHEGSLFLYSIYRNIVIHKYIHKKRDNLKSIKKICRVKLKVLTCEIFGLLDLWYRAFRFMRLTHCNLYTPLLLTPTVDKAESVPSKMRQQSQVECIVYMATVVLWWPPETKCNKESDYGLPAHASLILKAVGSGARQSSVPRREY